MHMIKAKKYYFSNFLQKDKNSELNAIRYKDPKVVKL